MWRGCGVTVRSVLSDDGHRLAGVLQCRSGLFVRGHAQVHAVHLTHTHRVKNHNGKNTTAPENAFNVRLL